MVNVAENRAVVACRLVGVAEPGPQEGWWSVPVSVEAAEDVEGYPNLLAAELPREMSALVPAELFDPDLLNARLTGQENWWVEAELVGPHRLRVRAPAEPPAEQR